MQAAGAKVITRVLPTQAVTQYFSGKLKVQGELALAMEFAELADVVLRSARQGPDYTESEA